MSKGFKMVSSQTPNQISHYQAYTLYKRPRRNLFEAYHQSGNNGHIVDPEVVIEEFSSNFEFCFQI